MSGAEELKIIEQNHLGHFEFLPKSLGFDVTEIHGVTIINCALASSMFNIAYGAPKNVKNSDFIQEIKHAFGGQPFAWWIPPSQRHPEVTKTLLENDMIVETIEHAMICKLDDVTALHQKSDLLIKPATDRDLLAEFISVLEPYDPAVRRFYDKIGNELLQSQENFFVGYEGKKPVTIGILFVNGATAGIFSLLTNDNSRGKGYGTGMMNFLINVAKEKTCKFITLSASSDSGYRIYERLGFRKIGEFECFEYKGHEHCINNPSVTQEEISLKGGRTTSEVIRVADEVHRLQNDNSKFVHALLSHLENARFNGAPRFLGIDSKNREILSYIEGEVPSDLCFWTDKVLISAAKLIRTYHDATVKFSEHCEVVCHNDLSPCNTVFQQGIPVAFIDFDAAAPGKRLDDLAYAVWLWCDLGNEEISPVDQSRRIQLFCNAYELQQTASIINAIVDIQKRQIEKYQINVKNGMREWESATSWAKKCLAWVENNRKILEAHIVHHRYLMPDDILSISKAFSNVNWSKPSSLFEEYLTEVAAGERLVWVAFIQDRFAGYITLKWKSQYPFFREKNIPEIMDLNVLPYARKMGVGTLLLELAEKIAATKSDIVGIGVGLYAGKDGGYGAAQRLYVKRGYIPDGKGVTYNYQPTIPGNSYPLDDDLVLWFTKKLS